MRSYARATDLGPDGLGYETVINDTANGSCLIHVLALGVSKCTPIEDGEVAVTAEL